MWKKIQLIGSNNPLIRVHLISWAGILGATYLAADPPAESGMSAEDHFNHLLNRSLYEYPDEEKLGLYRYVAPSFIDWERSSTDFRSKLRFKGGEETHAFEVTVRAIEFDPEKDLRTPEKRDSKDAPRRIVTINEKRPYGCAIDLPDRVMAEISLKKQGSTKISVPNDALDDLFDPNMRVFWFNIEEDKMAPRELSGVQVFSLDGGDTVVVALTGGSRSRSKQSFYRVLFAFHQSVYVGRHVLPIRYRHY